MLRKKARQKADHADEPTAGILDSQSVKTTEEAEAKGYDVGKKVKGRKRHLLVDTLGLVLVAWMSAADVQDRDEAQAVLPLAAGRTRDSGGISWPARVESLVLQSKRWIVERTFGWLNRERRLAKDYERKEESSAAFTHLGMMRLMLRRLA